MLRKILLTALTLFSLMILVACGAAGPETTQAPAAEPVATEAVAAEAEPTVEPAEEPTVEPAEEPTVEPAEEPTAEPAEEPTAEPAEEPTAEPTEEPAEASEEDSTAMSDGEATYTVDTTTSSVLWYGSKPIGASESGTVDIAEGQLNFMGSELVDGMMVIDMQTIETTSQTGGMAQQLLDHLSSDDFFGVATYPTATLLLKSAEPTEVENQYLVTADLTIKEITKEIEFITDVVVDGEMITANADIVVDRADFDVRYGSGSFFSNLGNDLISDEMEITVVLVATR